MEGRQSIIEFKSQQRDLGRNQIRGWLWIWQRFLYAGAGKFSEVYLNF